MEWRTTRWRGFAIRDKHLIYVWGTGYVLKTLWPSVRVFFTAATAKGKNVSRTRRTRYSSRMFSIQICTCYRSSKFTRTDEEILPQDVSSSLPVRRRVFFSGASSRYNFYSLPVIIVTTINAFFKLMIYRYLL